MPPNFEVQSTANLQRRAHMAGIAIWVAWVGAAFAVSATLYQWLSMGDFPVLVFVIAVFTLALTAPVFRERSQIKKILDQRH